MGKPKKGTACCFFGKREGNDKEVINRDVEATGDGELRQLGRDRFWS